MVEVTEEDRGAVRAFHAKALGLAISGNEANRLLAEAFARHRIAAESAKLDAITALRARITQLEAAQSPKPSQTN